MYSLGKYAYRKWTGATPPVTPVTVPPPVQASVLTPVTKVPEGIDGFELMEISPDKTDTKDKAGGNQPRPSRLVSLETLSPHVSSQDPSLSPLVSLDLSPQLSPRKQPLVGPEDLSPRQPSLVSLELSPRPPQESSDSTTDPTIDVDWVKVPDYVPEPPPVAEYVPEPTPAAKGRKSES